MKQQDMKAFKLVMEPPQINQQTVHLQYPEIVLYLLNRLVFIEDILIIVGDMYRVDECNSVSRIETSVVTCLFILLLNSHIEKRKCD